MTIKALVEADLERIKFIDRAAFSEAEQYENGMYWRMLQSGLSVVALDDSGMLVGYAYVQINPYTHVRSLAVHPDFRRLGYGKALMQAIIDHADHEVDLLVDEANEPAIRLYKSLGFQFAEICPTVPPKRRMILQITGR